ncbi:MAG: adenylate/guanylate cyclase domain-containing protein [Armatimonadetes bacterium]|nr:adenylate/guanylate cyclase domain-containing protein [Armatimonadota bacterium]
MESNYRNYDYLSSFARIDSYLDTNESAYEEVDNIPGRDKLTYSNGFNIQHCTALFVDIRGSSALVSKHTRPVLAKIYRSYISEVVAILNGSIWCSEINIVGDGVCGIFGTPYTSSIDEVFARAAMIQSVIDVLNFKLSKRKLTTIKCGIGIDYGRLLMVKAGYNGSGVNDVVWMGRVVNGASNLSHFGNRELLDNPLMVSSLVYSNLNEHNQKLLSYNMNRGCYHGYVIDTAMNEWLQANR